MFIANRAAIVGLHDRAETGMMATATLIGN